MPDNLNTYKIAVIPGDGIGPEIVPAGVDVLDAAAGEFGFQLDCREFPYGVGHYKKTGAFMPENALSILKKFDAIYFGAVGPLSLQITCWLRYNRLLICS